MGAFADLMTLADVEALRKGRPILKVQPGQSRLDRKAAKDTIDERALDRWRSAVYARDRYRCRVCKRKVTRSLELSLDQAHAHHIVSRRVKAVRTDQRNGVCVCAGCHEDIERHRIVIVGKASEMFVAEDGKSYLNGDVMTLEFVRT